jgi:ComF family protein
VRLDADSFVSRAPAGGASCSDCEKDPPPFAGVIAYGEYRDELRELIHLLKYERVASVAGLLGEMLTTAIDQRREALPQPLLVTAVPLYASKLRERGANQAEQIARAVARKLRQRGWEVEQEYGLLERRRATRSQTELNYKQRRANLRGVFTLAEKHSDIAGKNILLIDDIVTTSTTARECSKVLRRAGVSTVWMAAVARTQWDEVAQWDPKQAVSESTGTGARVQ